MLGKVYLHISIVAYSRFFYIVFPLNFRLTATFLITLSPPETNSLTTALLNIFSVYLTINSKSSAILYKKADFFTYFFNHTFIQSFHILFQPIFFYQYLFLHHLVKFLLLFYYILTIQVKQN